jgi:hypothetical protein
MESPGRTDAKSMEYLQRKVTSNKWTWPKRQAMWVGPTKPVGVHTTLSNLELQDLVFALLGFSLALVQSFLVILLFLPFGIGMYHCMWKYVTYFLIL